MNGISKAIGSIDLAIEGFFTAWLMLFLGKEAWSDYPGSSEARAVLKERRRKRRMAQ